MNKPQIGLIIADVDEYRPFLERLSGIETQPYSSLGRPGVLFTVDGVTVACVHCGIGKVNAAVAAAHLIDDGCRCLLNYGLSGGIHGVRRGDYVAPERFLEHDFDMTVIGYAPCEKPGQDYWYRTDPAFVKTVFAGLPIVAGGTAVSGDRFISSAADRDFFRDTFQAVSCDMETAAIATVCESSKVPVACLRRISDDAGEDAGVTYREMNADPGQAPYDWLLQAIRQTADWVKNA